MSSAMITSAFLVHLFLTLVSASQLRVVDLTHAHGDNTLVWPGNPNPNHTVINSGMTDGGFWFESLFYRTPDHAGTHLDAPAHFLEAGTKTQMIPMGKLFGPGVVINIKSKVKTNQDYRVEVQDLLDWETRNGRIPKGAVVLMNSGWDKFYPNRTLLFGSDKIADSSTFHFPSYHEDAADWLVKNRNIHILGVDTPSTDYGQSTTYPVHLILARAGIPGLENVANLDAIPEHGAIIFAAVFKLVDGSGGPARVFATLDVRTNGCPAYTSSTVLILVVTVLLHLLIQS